MEFTVKIAMFVKQNQIKQMPEQDHRDLKYLEEHLSCRHYLHTVENGFTCLEYKSPCEFTRETTKNELVMLLEGSCEVSYGEYAPHLFHSNEMFLVPRSRLFKVSVIKPCRLLVMLFDVPLNNCDKLALSECWSSHEADDYRFGGIEIRYPLTAFADLMCYLLKNAMSCEHIHEIKQKEFFFLLRGFYTKHEVATLFYPISSPSLDFKNSVLELFRPGIKADDLIEMSNMSRSIFYKRFVAEFGMPVNKWIAHQTVARIEFLVAEQMLSVKELMYAAGFTSASSFNRFCKRELGAAPSELLSRNSHRK